MNMLELGGAALAALLSFNILAWVLSLRLRDASIIDILWGPAFLVVTAVGFFFGGGWWERRVLLLVLVAAWSLRLALHLFARSRGRGEDYRYAEMRRAHGPRFWWVSLFTVFLLQSALAWIVSLPVQAAAARPGSPFFGLLDLAGALFAVLGGLFEAVADRQLVRFKHDPQNKGQVLDTGLWRYSRHPNYFGDAVVWWGLGLVGVAAGAPWSLVGSLAMTVLLLRVSGVTLLEKTITDRRPAYRHYIARTSAFIPWRPKSQPAASPRSERV